MNLSKTPVLHNTNHFALWMSLIQQIHMRACCMYVHNTCVHIISWHNFEGKVGLENGNLI